VNSKGVVLFSDVGSPIFRASYPEPNVAITKLETNEIAHSNPQFLPDDNHFIFYVQGNANARGVYRGSLDSQTVMRLLDADAAVFMAPNQLFYIREGKLFVRRMDMQTLSPVGDSTQIADRVSAISAAGGVLAYRPVAKPRPLNLFNRKGEPLPSDALTKAPVLQSMELSPDAAELAFTYQPSADFNVDIGIL